jgi:hypothetical protein
MFSLCAKESNSRTSAKKDPGFTSTTRPPNIRNTKKIQAQTAENHKRS